ncbi:ABC transporter permease [Microbispora triticiradicis]|uniref:Transport permease protein n=3 Tax=Microbispora TaxID=2005 RepID=A0ABY3LXD3_9ACTN|nr:MULTISPECIES: ABC transporter permease [Microbispora]RGA00566.1 ABC transporter permease [Microbispora triticiradicis]TLP60865.1 ABC transporter permease [Microbispora fusca]TYB58725.1 ABC transporter permease [Microbispora tritici]GLW25917.1 transport permease protein [Microbispora amethystogenes]
MKAFTALTAAELRLLSRDPASLFFMVAFPLMLLVLKRGDGGAVPGYLAMIAAIGGMGALPGLLASYRERKVLKRLATTPISPILLLGAQLVSQVAAGLAGSALLVVVTVAVFGARAPGDVLMLTAAFLLCSVMACALGFVIAAVVRNTRGASLIGMLVMFPMIFLSGAAVPRKALPGSLRQIGDFLPLTPAVEALGGAWSGTAVPFPLLILAGIIVAATATGAALFRWE